MLDAQVAHLSAVAVHDHIPRSILPPQQFVVGLFHARLAHHVTGVVIGKARVVQIFLAHLAHIADEVGGKAVIGIEPPLLVDGLELRQLVAMRLDKGFLVGRDVELDGDGLVAGRGAIAAESGAQLLHIEVQPARDQRQVVVHVAVLLANQKAGDRWVVVHDQPVLAIEEFAAWGQHGLFADAVLLGQKAVVVRAQHLQPPKPRGQRQHHQEDAVLHHRQLEGRKLFASVSHA